MTREKMLNERVISLEHELSVARDLLLQARNYLAHPEVIEINFALPPFGLTANIDKFVFELHSIGEFWRKKMTSFDLPSIDKVVLDNILVEVDSGDVSLRVHETQLLGALANFYEPGDVFESDALVKWARNNIEKLGIL